jgi:hypothetical protein
MFLNLLYLNNNLSYWIVQNVINQKVNAHLVQDHAALMLNALNHPNALHVLLALVALVPRLSLNVKQKTY